MTLLITRAEFDRMRNARTEQDYADRCVMRPEDIFSWWPERDGIATQAARGSSDVWCVGFDNMSPDSDGVDRLRKAAAMVRPGACRVTWRADDWVLCVDSET